MNVSVDKIGFKRKVKGLKSVLYSIFRLIILLAVSYIIIYPLLYMLSSALKTASAFQDPFYGFRRF